MMTSNACYAHVGPDGTEVVLTQSGAVPSDMMAVIYSPSREKISAIIEALRGVGELASFMDPLACEMGWCTMGRLHGTFSTRRPVLPDGDRFTTISAVYERRNGA